MLAVLALLTIHFVGDFLLQSNWMALNKSKRWDALALHAGVYALCFGYWGPVFVAVTFASHFLTDAVTSRWTAKLWFINLQPAGNVTYTIPNVRTIMPLTKRAHFVTVDTVKRHWFFVVIGADQLIHVWTLGLTYRWLLAS